MEPHDVRSSGTGVSHSASWLQVSAALDQAWARHSFLCLGDTPSWASPHFCPRSVLLDMGAVSTLGATLSNTAPPPGRVFLETSPPREWPGRVLTLYHSEELPDCFPKRPRHST